MLLQKLTYLHNNPVRAGVCEFPKQHKYISARMYQSGIDVWGFLTHFKD